jgi:hypothetical protein
MYTDNQTASIELVSQDTTEAILELAHSGLGHEDISFALNTEASQETDSDHPMDRARMVQQLKTQALEVAQQHEETLPTFIYSYQYDTGHLHRTNLATGEQSTHQVPSYTFKNGAYWSEVAGGSLLITGGGHPTAVREVVSIDTRREFAVAQQPPMLTPRTFHAAVYHTPHLYVIGGWSVKNLSECERYVCAENRWEALPPLPRACSSTSGVVIERSLYALGGCNDSLFDLVQKLSLESLTWEIMQFRLPFEGCDVPCLKLRDTEVYLVVNRTLCSFTALQVLPLRTLTEDIMSLYGASYYRRGVLYCSAYRGAVLSYEIGSLS